MSRGKLVTMAALLFFFECILAGPAIQNVAAGSYFPWMGALILVAAAIGIGFTGFLVWFAYAGRPKAKSESLIPEPTVYVPDPFFDWVRDNQALVRQYPNHHLAISPTSGIVAAARTDEEFERVLQSLELPDDTVITHSSLLIGQPAIGMVH